MDSTREDGGWPLRPAILAAIGVVAAVALQQLLDQDYAPGRITPPPSAGRGAIAALVATCALSFGYVAERSRLLWAVAFAGVVGVTAALVFWWNNGPSGEFLWDWRSAALFLAIAIAAPLFQTARDEGAWRFPYADVHGHAWTNVVLWFASWGFTGVVFAMAFLLSELFELIGIHALRDLLREEWFFAALGGGALGGALGLFRERDRILRLLQRVVTAVLSVLAPVLGVALLLFLLSLPFTGLGALWEATKATTPILLSCVVGALILANAVIGNGEQEESANPVLRYGAMALALAMLPFAAIAAVATGLRIQQYGFTPDRLWALTFVVIACAYGLAYLVALARGRMDWAEQVRPANLRLGFALAGLALFLALPIVSFNAISTHDQVVRLEGGKVAPDKFDWAALAFDFGEPGKRALAVLRRSPDAKLAKLANDAAAKTNRYEVAEVQAKAQTQAGLPDRLRVLPVATPIPRRWRRSWQTIAVAGCSRRTSAPSSIRLGQARLGRYRICTLPDWRRDLRTRRQPTRSPPLTAKSCGWCCAARRGTMRMLALRSGRSRHDARWSRGWRQELSRSAPCSDGSCLSAANRSAPPSNRLRHSVGNGSRPGMSVDTATVKKVASLARIAISDADAERLAPELNNILGWIEQLGEVDTSSVEPMAAVIPNTLRLRDDVVNADPLTGGGMRDAVLANAPVAEHGFFAVPKVIE